MKTSHVLLMVLIILLLCLLLSGCVWFADNRQPVSQTIDPNSPKLRAMLTYIVQIRAGNRWGIKEYKADVEYWKELQEKNRNGQGKSIRKDGCALERRH